MAGKETPQSTAGGPMKRTKRIRINFTHRQIEAMETVFKQTQYPDVTVIEVLAERLQLPIEKICTWFQNRRSKFRKESKKGHIQWMRQQVFSNSEVCTGVPVAPAMIDAASHVLSPPLQCEKQESPPTARINHHPAFQYHTDSQSTQMSTYCTSAFTTTPSHQYPMSGSPFNPCDIYNSQSQSGTCMTSWSGQHPLSSPQKYSNFDSSPFQSCAYVNSPDLTYPSASPPNGHTGMSPDSAYMSASPNSEACMGASPNSSSCMGASPINSQTSHSDGSPTPLLYFNGSPLNGYPQYQNNNNMEYRQKSTYELYKQWCNQWSNPQQEPDNLGYSSGLNQQPSPVALGNLGK